MYPLARCYTKRMY